MQRLISILFIPLFITSCASVSEYKNESKTVKELYSLHSNDNKDIANRKYRSLGRNSDYIRTSTNELSTRFPKLPNPTIHVFIYPHLVNNSHPVPGYSTTFKLYETDQFALPGEIY